MTFRKSEGTLQLNIYILKTIVKGGKKKQLALIGQVKIQQQCRLQCLGMKVPISTWAREMGSRKGWQGLGANWISVYVFCLLIKEANNGHYASIL